MAQKALKHQSNGIGSSSQTVNHPSLGHDESTHINQRHLDEWVKDSCVSESITRAAIQSLSDENEIAKLLNKSKWDEGPGYSIHGVVPTTGEPTKKGRQFKPDKPRVKVKDGKKDKRKYRFPTGESGFDVQPLFLGIPDNPNYWPDLVKRCSKSNPQSSIQIVIVEGAKKAGACLTEGYPAISLPGVTMGHIPDGKGPIKPLKEWLQLFAKPGVHFLIAFDMDSKTNKDVAKAEKKLAEALCRAGSSVSILNWDEQHKGIDDYRKVNGKGSIKPLTTKAVWFKPSRDYKSQKSNSATKSGSPDRVTSKQSDEPTLYQKTYYELQNILGDRLRFNSVAREHELDGVPLDFNHIQSTIAVDLNLKVKGSARTLEQIVKRLAELNTYNPIQDYLNDCYDKHKDGLDKLNDTWSKLSSEYLGSTDPLSNTFLGKTLLSAVARAFKPGCQVDTMLTLVGNQGTKKSTFIKTLASPKWFCNDFSNITDKDHLLKLHENWIIEWSELYGMGKRQVTALKAFLSTQTDKIREPYGRMNRNMSRPSILIGTSNESEFLGDPTGARRFWVIEVDRVIDIDKVKRDRDLIWASVVHAYRNNTEWWLTGEEEQGANVVRERYQDSDVWAEDIEDHLADKDKIAIVQIANDVFKTSSKDFGQGNERRVKKILVRLGFKATGQQEFLDYSWDPEDGRGKQWTKGRKRMWERSSLTEKKVIGKKSVQVCSGELAEAESITSTGLHGVHTHCTLTAHLETECAAPKDEEGVLHGSVQKECAPCKPVLEGDTGTPAHCAHQNGHFPNFVKNTNSTTSPLPESEVMKRKNARRVNGI